MSRRFVLAAVALVLVQSARVRADDDEATDDDEAEPEPQASSEEADTAPALEASSTYVPSSRASGSSGIEYTNADFDISDAHSWLRGWTGTGYFRTATHTRRGPVIHSDALIMAVNVAFDVSRHGYWLELASRGLNDFTTLHSRTFHAVFGEFVSTGNVVDHRNGSPLDGIVLRARYVKYLARGARWRFGCGLVASDYFHVAGDQANKMTGPFQEAWFITAGPIARFDYMFSKRVQARFGASPAFGLVSLKDGGARPYPVSAFVHVRLARRFYVGVESSVVLGVPDVFTQRHELQLGVLR